MHIEVEKKTIKRLRKEYLTEDIALVKSYAVPHNDSWCGVAARLAVRDRKNAGETGV